MTNRPASALLKWPFLLADLGLLIGCAWVITQALPARAYLVVAVAVVAWMFGAWLCVLPWLKEFQAAAKRDETEDLTSALEQINKLEEIGARVQAATGSWQSAQDAAARVTATAKELEERIRADSKDFMEFAERIHNDEKQNLRLEVEKLRRAEAEWLQVAARMLDHTFAITQAAMRSGQPNLATQMTNFQNACRDAARRVGLIAFVPGMGDAFDERTQQLEDTNAKPEEGAVVADVLATGYTFQGQLLRKALVRLSTSEAGGPIQPAEQEPEPVREPEPVEQSSPPQQNIVTEQVEQTPPPSAAEHATDSADQWERVEESFEQHQTETQTPAESSVMEEDSAPPVETERVVEVAAAETAVEQALPSDEEKPRRRRKTDPQTSLPF